MAWRGACYVGQSIDGWHCWGDCNVLVYPYAFLLKLGQHVCKYLCMYLCVYVTFSKLYDGFTLLFHFVHSDCFFFLNCHYDFYYYTVIIIIGEFTIVKERGGVLI